MQKTSEDGPFGAQPAPLPSAPPAQFSEELLRSALEVPWHRPWKGEGEEPVRSWQDVSEEQTLIDDIRDATSAAEDPTARARRLRHERA